MMSRQLTVFSEHTAVQQFSGELPAVSPDPGRAYLPGTLKLNRVFTFLLLFLAVYLVMPVVDLPIGGLSISTPVMGLIALRVLMEPRGILGRYTGWIIWAYIFWLAVLASLVGSYLSGRNPDLSLDDAILMVRYAFWMLTFIIMIMLTSLTSDRFMNLLAVTLGLATLALAGLRLYEAIAFGRWGAWTGASILTQNTYGWLFSTFSPFVFFMMVRANGWKRILAVSGFVMMLAAVAGNGSRSSWFTVALGVLISVGLYSFSRQVTLSRITWVMLLLVVLTVGVISFLPDEVMAPILERFSTLENVEEEGSFGVRELMIQKGVKLFLTNPLLGVGPGRFREVSVPLDIPYNLVDNSQAHFDRKSSHNSYISLLAESGLVAVIPLAVLLLILTVRGPLAVIPLAQVGELWTVPVYAGFIGMSIHLWSLSGLASTAPWFVYGMLAGILYRSAALRQRQIRALRAEGGGV